MATVAASTSMSSTSMLVPRSQFQSATSSRAPRELDLRRSNFCTVSRTIPSKRSCMTQNALRDALTVRCSSRTYCHSRLPVAANPKKPTLCSSLEKLDFGRRLGIRNLNGLRKNEGCSPLPARTSLLHHTERRGALDPCHARSMWFGSGQETEQETEAETLPEALKKSSGRNLESWSILKRWDIPWDAKATSLGMVGWLLSFLLTGLVMSIVAGEIGLRTGQLSTLNEQAICVLYELAQTFAGLAVVNSIVKPHKLFSIEWQSPFSLQKGWALWGGIGTLCDGVAVMAVSYAAFQIYGKPPQNKNNALVQLMPLIGASPLSTISVIGMVSVLAPVLEEIIFRGFLMTSLTKWVPTPVAIILSACAFAAVHFTPEEFPQLLSSGIILGLSYAQTRNLLTPVLIHSIWNSGVVALLAFLRLHGYDMKNIMS